MNIGQRIQGLRKQRGISQEKLADKVGVSRQAVSKWESEQSLPDLDRVLLMSEYFGVSTDYLLKGVELPSRQSMEEVNANLFVIVATALNLIGLIVSVSIWYEKQITAALVVGIIFMALGCMVFGVGFLNSALETRETAKRNFWVANIWILAFLPLSVAYNLIFSHQPAPYPLLSQPLAAYPIFWLIYLGVCLAVAFLSFRAIKNKR